MAYIDNVTNILQIQPDGLPTFVRLSQNENGRNLYFQLAGNEIDIPANSTITISGTKPDGTVYSGTGSISDNVILIPEMIQMTAVAGYWDAKVKIISGGNTIATGRIRFVIDADTVDPDSVPSDSELEGLVAEAQQYAETARTEAYGSPLTAQTAAGMTDHTRVYVYTGSESGYTAGHWYYWDGTQWADGGIYNSTATNTDPTLTLAGVPADAKATGDKLTGLREDLNTITPAVESMYSELYGSDIPPTLLSVSGLNFVDGASNYNTNASYTTQYIRALKDITYKFVFTNIASSGRPFLRIVFSSAIPAANVAGTQLVTPQVELINTYTFTYTPEADGYIGIAAWGIPSENYDTTVEIIGSGGLVDEVDAVEQAMTSVQEDVEDVSGDVAALQIQIDGGQDAVSTTLVPKLNRAENATSYATNNNYSTIYFPVQKDKSYSITLYTSRASSQYRLCFAENIPADGVLSDFIEKYNFTPTTEETLLINKTADKDGYLSISWYSAGGEDASLTVLKMTSGIVDDINDLNDRVTALEGQGNSVAPEFQTLYYDAEAIIQDSTNVKMNQWTVVPYDSTEIHVHLPKDIVAQFILQKSPSDTTSVTTQYVGDGEKVTLTPEYTLYKIVFGYGEKVSSVWQLTGDMLSASDFNNLVTNGKIVLYYRSNDVIVNNVDIEKKLMAYIGNGANTVFTHISDTHGDASRYRNFLEMSRHIGATCAIHSGDAVNNDRLDGMQYCFTGVKEYPDVPTIYCIGNHEAGGTNATVYNAIIKPFDDGYTYALSDAKTYYHKDFTDKKIRVIVLNIYDELQLGYRCCIQKAQIDWFISTLASTPSEYGVVVVAHSLEKITDKMTGLDMFYEDDFTPDWTTTFVSITGNPVSTIIDAFISRSSITGSYTQTIKESASSSTQVTAEVSYAADFTAVPSSVEFIASINGHAHRDLIGYLSNTTNMQLNLNITHGVISGYYEGQGDLPRHTGRGSVQDAFNVYVIDRVNKVVKVIRIGSNVTYDLTDRDFMIIPYSQSN